ncbi:MAG: type III pantothenate kinase [Bacteroidia bacterium]|nr:type III pantothenate kinase [Bacteroidia bacterium]
MVALICVDIGNQNLKFAKFSANGDMIEVQSTPKTNSLSILDTLSNQVPIILSDVSGITDSMELKNTITRVHAELKLPFSIGYNSTTTLGTDRLCSIAGASYLKPQSNCLVFNLGTCLTIDFIDDAGNYKGGNISPGLTLRYKSLHEFTAKLPMIAPTDSTELIGKNTSSAISNGVQNGLLAELEFYINRFASTAPQLNIFLTGGDAVYFEKQLKTKIFAAPYLTLYGLFNIAKFNGII